MKRVLITFGVITIAFLSCKKNKDKVPPSKPVVTTAAVTNITFNSATGGGSIVSDGGAVVTKSGVVWSLTNNTPTLKDSVVAGTTPNGTFTSNITGLDFNRTYYVRAFAINSVDTAFGNVVSFTTVVDTNKVRFTYNGQEVTYGIIISSVTGRKWLDRNLGAKHRADSLNDYNAYGDLFQWGRPADGHQLMNWTSSTTGEFVNGMTTVLATSDTPGHSNFIDASASSTKDWRSDNNMNRWLTNPQGPCPAGWHVPTIDEWLAEVSKTLFGTATSGGMTDRNTAYSQLKLTVAGRRRDFGPAGQLGAVGSIGYYWSITDKINLDGYSNVTDFEVASAYVQQNIKNNGGAVSVRCLKN